MTNPATISSETIGSEIFEIGQSLFLTSRGNCGVRKVYTVRRVGSYVREKLTRLVWEARREAALGSPAPISVSGPMCSIYPDESVS